MEAVSQPRYDAFRMYSGLPQRFNTFRANSSLPKNHPSYPNIKNSNIESFSLNNEKNLINNEPNIADSYRMYLDQDKQGLKSLLKEIKNKKDNINIENDFAHTNVMGSYNKRYLNGNTREYNDIWDLHPAGFKTENISSSIYFKNNDFVKRTESLLFSSSFLIFLSDTSRKLFL